MSWAPTQPSILSREHVSSKCKAARTTQGPHAVNNHISPTVCHSAMIWKADSGEHSRNYRSRRGGRAKVWTWSGGGRREKEMRRTLQRKSFLCLGFASHSPDTSAPVSIKERARAPDWHSDTSEWMTLSDVFPLFLSLILLSPSTIGG